MRKFESSQKDESRVQLADFSKAYRKSRDFNCLFQWFPTGYMGTQKDYWGSMTFICIR